MTKLSHPLRNGSIPTLGFGTWQSKPGEVGKAVRVALDTGYRHIDCAYIYGNQKEIGQVFNEYFNSENSSLKREDVWITSKLWNTSHRYSNVRKELQQTLKDLQLDYLDLYLIHWPVSFPPDGELFPKDDDGKVVVDEEADLKETWKAMEELCKEGLVRNIGVSNYNIRLLKQMMDYAEIPPSVNQIELHPYLTQEEMVKFCNENNIHLTAFCPLGSAKEPRLMDDETLSKIASKHNKTPAQVLIRWAMQRGTSVIPKSVTPSRIESNFKVFDFELSDEDMKQLNALDKHHRYVNPKEFMKLNVYEE